MANPVYSIVNNVVGLTLSGSGVVYTPGTFPANFTLSSGGSLFGSPNAANPLRMTVITAATYQTAAEALTIYEVTGVSGNVITVAGVIEGSTDRTFSGGDKVDLRITAGSISDLNSIVTPDIVGSISAAGTTQAAATALAAPSFAATRTIRVVSSATAGSAVGVALPTAVTGNNITVINTSSTTITVWPVNGGSATMNGTANGTVMIPPNGSATFAALSATAWSTTSTGFSSVASVFPTSGTFPLSPGSNWIEMHGIGGGGAGGSGACGSNNVGGGGGGGAAGYSTARYRTIDLLALASSLTVTVGTGGTGGTAAATAGGNGVVGGDGTATQVLAGATVLLNADQGKGGGAGQAGVAGAAGTGSVASQYNGGNGTAGGLAAAASSATTAINIAPGAGAGGGGVSSGGTGNNGGIGGQTYRGSLGGNRGTAGTPGTNGNPGSSQGTIATSPQGAGGAGGGGATTAASSTAGNGGAGGTPGGGGGGGGAAISTATACSIGGNGGAGLVVIFAN